jgi:hypothetical protein
MQPVGNFIAQTFDPIGKHTKGKGATILTRALFGWNLGLIGAAIRGIGNKAHGHNFFFSGKSVQQGPESKESEATHILASQHLLEGAGNSNGPDAPIPTKDEDGKPKIEDGPPVPDHPPETPKPSTRPPKANTPQLITDMKPTTPTQQEAMSPEVATVKSAIDSGNLDAAIKAISGTDPKDYQEVGDFFADVKFSGAQSERFSSILNDKSSEHLATSTSHHSEISQQFKYKEAPYGNSDLQFIGILTEELGDIAANLSTGSHAFNFGKPPQEIRGELILDAPEHMKAGAKTNNTTFITQSTMSEKPDVRKKQKAWTGLRLASALSQAINGAAAKLTGVMHFIGGRDKDKKLSIQNITNAAGEKINAVDIGTDELKALLDLQAKPADKEEALQKILGGLQKEPGKFALVTGTDRKIKAPAVREEFIGRFMVDLGHAKAIALAARIQAVDQKVEQTCIVEQSLVIFQEQFDAGKIPKSRMTDDGTFTVTVEQGGNSNSVAYKMTLKADENNKLEVVNGKFLYKTDIGNAANPHPEEVQSAFDKGFPSP